MTSDEANIKLRRFVGLGCECLTTVGWEMARLALEPVLAAYEQEGLGKLSTDEILRLKTAAAALASVLDAAPPGLDDTARASLIERARPTAALMELYATFMRDRVLPAAYATDELHAAVGAILVPLAEEIHTEVASQQGAQARIDTGLRELAGIVHELQAWLPTANPGQLAAVELDAFSQVERVDFGAAMQRLMSQDDLYVRWITKTQLSDEASLGRMPLRDARATLGFGVEDGFDQALARFRASVIALLPELLAEWVPLDGPRQRWLQLCLAIEAVAACDEVGTVTSTSPAPTLQLSGAAAQRLGPYVLGEVLGRGGTGTVYRATDSRSGAVAAVKVLDDSLAKDGRFIRRFEREVLASQAVDHPAVVRVRELCWDAGTAFLVSDLVAGSDLARLLLDEGPLRPARASRIIADVASGLAALHACGIVHRDVKPANVLIVPPGTAEERAVLSDFGVALITESELTLTQPGVVLGTPAYLAPEVARGDTAGPAADQYALACVLHETLTGRRPTAGRIAGTFEPHTRGALARALDADPTRRFPSIVDFARAAGPCPIEHGASGS